MPTVAVAIDASRAKAGAAVFSGAANRMVSASQQLNFALVKLVGAFSAFAIIREQIRVMSEFGQTMATVRGVTGATEEQFARLEATAKGLGATTRFTATEAAEGLLFLARAGFDAEEAIVALPNALNLAQAGAISFGEAADYATNIVMQFGLEAGELVRVVDTLVAVSNRSNTNVSQLAQALKYAGPVAGATGRSLEETAAVIGTLGNAGLQASLAGTNLRGIMAGLFQQSGRSKRAFEKLGISIDDINPAANDLATVFSVFREAGLSSAEAVAIFGRRNSAAALILKDNVDTIRDLERAALLAAGEGANMAKVMDDTLRGSLLALKSAIEATMLATGDSGLGGAFRGLVDLTTGVFRVFAGIQGEIVRFKNAAILLADAINLLVIRFVALKALSLAAFFGRLIATSAAYVTAFGLMEAATLGLSIATKSLLGPLGLIASAIGLAVTVFFHQQRAAEELTQALEKGNTAYKEFTDVVQDYHETVGREERFRAQIGTLEELIKNLEMLKKARDAAAPDGVAPMITEKIYSSTPSGTAAVVPSYTTRVFQDPAALQAIKDFTEANAQLDEVTLKMLDDFTHMRDAAVSAYEDAAQAFEQNRSLDNATALQKAVRDLSQVFLNVSRVSDVLGGSSLANNPLQ